MTGLLLKIQDSVSKYVDVMSKIGGTDVEVVDTKLLRVAGTGMFQEFTGLDISEEAHVYKGCWKPESGRSSVHPGRNQCAKAVHITETARKRLRSLCPSGQDITERSSA